MNIRHKFYDNINGFIDEEHMLCNGDFCIHCGFIVDEEIERMFIVTSEIHKFDDYYEDYKLELEFCYKCVNEKKSVLNPRRVCN